MLKDAKDYFDQAKKIWAPLQQHGRIIPLCTPVTKDAPAMVIGTNHSVFTKGATITNDTIGQTMSLGVPTLNTFTQHNHSFAAGLRSACQNAGIQISTNWVGTNRCSIQTGPDGINHLKRNATFNACQAQMDKLIFQLIEYVMPTNIVLAGGHAIDLFYPKRIGTIDSLKCLNYSLSGSNKTIKVIPILHPSMNFHRERISNKLKACFLHN